MAANLCIASPIFQVPTAREATLGSLNPKGNVQRANLAGRVAFLRLKRRNGKNWSAIVSGASCMGRRLPPARLSTASRWTASTLDKLGGAVFSAGLVRRQTALSSTGPHEALLIGSPLVSCRVLRSTVQHKTGPGHFPARQPGCSGGASLPRPPSDVFGRRHRTAFFIRAVVIHSQPLPSGDRQSRVLRSSRTRQRGGLLLACMAVELPNQSCFLTPKMTRAGLGIVDRPTCGGRTRMEKDVVAISACKSTRKTHGWPVDSANDTHPGSDRN